MAMGWDYTYPVLPEVSLIQQSVSDYISWRFSASGLGEPTTALSFSLSVSLPCVWIEWLP